MVNWNKYVQVFKFHLDLLLQTQIYLSQGDHYFQVGFGVSNSGMQNQHEVIINKIFVLQGNWYILWIGKVPGTWKFEFSKSIFRVTIIFRWVMEFQTRGCKISMKLSIKLMYFKETAIFCELAKCQVLEIRVFKVNLLCQKIINFSFHFFVNSNFVYYKKKWELEGGGKKSYNNKRGSFIRYLRVRNFLNRDLLARIWLSLWQHFVSASLLEDGVNYS